MNFLLKSFLILLLSTSITSCSFLFNKDEKTFSKRLKTFEAKKWNLKKKVDVYWNKQGVPYIYAENDLDLFYVTGLVQSFLRQGQMELFRRLSQGRLSEMIGKRGHDIDTLIRTIGYDKAVEEIKYNFTKEESLILESFVKGINDFNKKIKKVPLDLKLLGVKELEPWSLDDLIRVHRFTSSDVNWMVWPRFIKIMDEEGFKGFWKDWAIEESFKGVSLNQNDFLNESLFSYVSDAGSNAFVIGKSKSYSRKAPIVAGDPHLGLMVPNLWLLIGQSSPSFNSLGVFMPTFPVPVMGRTDHLAWTGTNMWGLNTYFFNLSDDEISKLGVRKEVIKTRWGKDKIIEVRESLKGPVISDTKFFRSKKPVALSWTGHFSSNEVGSFIKANKAKSVNEFRDSFKDYGQVALNFVVADKENNLAKIHVLKQPVLNINSEKKLIQDSFNFVKNFKNSKDFPIILNPKKGFLVSANEPVLGVEPSPTWFSPPMYRYDRISDLIGKDLKVDLSEIKKIQNDVFLKPSKDMVLFWKEQYPSTQPSFLVNLLNWDYKYEENLEEPYIFEELAAFFAKKVFNLKKLSLSQIKVLMSHSSWKEKSIKAFKSLKLKERKEILIALEAKSKTINKNIKWKDVHKLNLSHPLAKLPLIGKYFTFYDGGYPGGNETVFKALHKSGENDYSTKFGANLRLIFDLSDEDKNYTSLMGGQDGYFWSEHTFDQFSKWRKGEYSQTYFKKETVIKTAKKLTSLRPI